MSNRLRAALAVLLALAHGGALAAAADPAKKQAAKGAPLEGADLKKAEAARKKPLQRCDELADKAQLECLRKAREGIVGARQKREASAKGEDKGAAKAK